MPLLISRNSWAASSARFSVQSLRRLFGGDALEGDPTPHAAAVPFVSAAQVEPQRVLVVDDNPVNLLLAEQLLSQFGIRPLMAADGAEAVALAGGWALDLILMDLQMPVLDGLTATRQIRHDERLHGRPRVPVVAYTSCAPATACLRKFGIDGVLDKPCDARALEACLATWQLPYGEPAGPRGASPSS